MSRHLWVTTQERTPTVTRRSHWPSTTAVEADSTARRTVLFEVSQRFSRLSTPGSDQAVLPLKTYVSGRAAKQKCACRPGNRSATAATGAVHSGAPDFGR